MGGIGPMFGQVGFFHKFAGKDIEDKRPRDRYVNEAKRLLQVLETRLEGRDWIMDEYTIADMSMIGWVRGLVGFYGAGGWSTTTASRTSPPGSNAHSPARRSSAVSTSRRAG